LVPNVSSYGENTNVETLRMFEVVSGNCKVAGATVLETVHRNTSERDAFTIPVSLYII